MLRPAIQLLVMIVAAGCDKPDAPAPAPAGNASTQAADTSRPAPAAFGTLRGKVILTGWTPPPPAAQMVTCGDHQIPVTDQKVILKGGGLENVVIYLKNASPSTVTATPTSAILDQKNCTYVPHVLALRTNQTLTIKSSENMLHNIHALPQNNPGVNFGMIKAGQRDVVFKNAEIFRVKCDVHPWMMAWIAVFDHPFFAVSANGGRFEIQDIPVGTQTFVAWHERFGELEQTVTVTTDQPREITFNFEPPKEK